MERIRTLVRPSHLLFAGVAAVVYASAITVAGLLPSLERPGAVAVGLTLDLVVVVPLAFYLLVVRRGRLPIVALAPVLALGFVAASRILPADQRHTLRLLEALAAPLELGLIGWVAWRASKALRVARRDGPAEPLEQIHRAALELIRHPRAAAILATEVAMFYFAIGAWRARPHAPAGMSAMTQHVRSGHAGILLGLSLIVAVEGFAVHFLLARWSVVTAWVFTIGSAYTLLWLLADYRATVLRPILVSDEVVHLRAGLRWTLRAPRAVVADVVREKPDLGKEVLNLTFLGNPTHWIVFSRPITAHGPYGLTRCVRAVGLEPDDAAKLVDGLGARTGSRS